jgi:hypothetical protein
MTYEASGTMPCSAGEPSYDQACGWRVLRFSNGEFTDRDGDSVQVSKDGEMWSISVGREHYRFADALIAGG